METRRQASHFTTGSIGVDRPAARSFIQHFGRLLELGARLGLVAAFDRDLGVLGGGARAAADEAILLRAFKVLTMALLRRRMNWNMRHNPF